MPSETSIREPERVTLFGMPIARTTLADATAQVLRWRDEPGPCRYVVTPNVDHAVMFQHDAALRAAYADAAALSALPLLRPESM